ncbi:putative PPE family protein PPE42 [Mycobacterium basiliense]|uniref:Putative PPE family protein PPE42 n=1 Tax=Mycobacterium basiliense TaxID=2094119 RepID=A0A3S4FM65_9MYCO|nr:putative PPE family protein PPE42 [Mycobacterium basiliense]
MDFAVLPPEVNSARIFGGAGLDPMMAAATARDGLAGELRAAQDSFSSATSRLAGEFWQGPAALAMTRAAGPYALWLSTAAGQAEQAAGQVRLAASAFEADRVSGCSDPVRAVPGRGLGLCRRRAAAGRRGGVNDALSDLGLSPPDLAWPQLP